MVMNVDRKSWIGMRNVEKYCSLDSDGKRQKCNLTGFRGFEMAKIDRLPLVVPHKFCLIESKSVHR